MKKIKAPLSPSTRSHLNHVFADAQKRAAFLGERAGVKAGMRMGLLLGAASGSLVTAIVAVAFLG